jgi:hypothetical protein
MFWFLLQLKFWASSSNITHPQNLQQVQQLEADHCLEKISWLVSPSQQNLKKYKAGFGAFFPWPRVCASGWTSRPRPNPGSHP